MSNKRDYTSFSFLIAIIVMVIMLLIYFVPAFKIGKINIKRTNIISDIISQEDSADLIGADVYFDTTFLAESISSTEATKISEPENIPTAKIQNWELGSSSSTNSGTPSNSEFIKRPKDQIPTQIQAAISSSKLTEIEDFSPDKKYLDRLYASLSNTDKTRPTRLAIMGDSFIEGDIISADIREQMQTIYGGEGIGFIPFSSPVSKYRGTIKHTFKGWTTYNVIQKRSTPTELKDKFFVSGMICIPEEGAKCRLQGVTFRKHLKKYSVAKLLFINEKNSTLNVIVNDSTKRVFTPESSPYVQQINVSGEIETLDVSIDNVDGFIGYGIIMEDRSGVSVDNYSIRGNSGMALFATDASVNRQINKIVGYDMVVLQYGLNAMSANVLNYNSYSSQLVKIINYVKKCFPESAILVMSVGDRSTLRDGEFVTMPAVHAMIEAQRAAAQKTEVAFWNTFLAMGGENSMVGFVQRNWAAKDYTHIGYAGGRFIGNEFVKSLVNAGSESGVKEQPSSQKATVPVYTLNIDSTK